MATAILPPQSLDCLTLTNPQRNSNSQQAPQLSIFGLPQSIPDFSTDSAPSPDSPTFPVFTNTYNLNSGVDGWLWDDKAAHSPQFPDFISDNFDDTIAVPALTPSFQPRRTLSLSPAINPMDLTNQHMEDVVFNNEPLDDSAPLFQSPYPAVPEPSYENVKDVPRRLRQGQRRPSQSAGLTIPPELTMCDTSSPPSPLSDPQPSRHQRLRRVNPDIPTSRKRKSRSGASGDNAESSRESSPSCASNSPRLPTIRAIDGNRRLSRRSKTGTATNTDATPTTTSSITDTPKKSAHNLVEKRYRNNLNDKIALLRDSVPSLRVMVHRLETTQGPSGGSTSDADAEADDDMDEDLGGLAPAHKLNKATILSKATEYIAHLERQNRNMARDNATLRSQVDAFNAMILSRGNGNVLWT